MLWLCLALFCRHVLSIKPSLKFQSWRALALATGFNPFFLSAISSLRWEPNASRAYCSLISRSKSPYLPVVQLVLTCLRFISAHWEEYRDQLCVLLPGLYRSGSIQRSSMPFPGLSKSAIMSSFADLNASTLQIESSVSYCSGFLGLTEVMIIEESLDESIQQQLAKLLRATLESESVSR